MTTSHALSAGRRFAWPLLARGAGRQAVVFLLAASLAAPASANPPLQPAKLSEDEYAETFTFVADLSDGTYLQVQFTITNLGPGDGTGVCRALAKRPKEPAWSSSERVGSKGWNFRVEGEDQVLQVGPCSARSGASGTKVRAPLDGRVVEVTFPKAVREGASPASMTLDGRTYDSTILQAFATVTARLEGFPMEAKLEGAGFAARARSNVAPASVARTWVRFRTVVTPGRLVVLARQRVDGAWDAAWLWREGAEPRTLVGGTSLVRTGRSPSPKWEAGLPGLGTVRSGALLDRYAPVEELGFLKTFVAPMLGSPVTYTYRATLAVPGGPSVEGLLEVAVQAE